MAAYWPRGLGVRWLAALLLAIPCAVSAQSVPPPPVQPTIIQSGSDLALRMTVPVTIDGAGPFHFIVDTGADRTVVSRELADRLALEEAGAALLYSIAGVSRVSTVVLEKLNIAGITVPRIKAPALSEANLGAQGLLGIDSLKNRRIIMDFDAQTLTIAEPGAREPIDPDTIVVTARSRFGQLVLVDASIDGVAVTVIIDSGAQSTIGNFALRSLLAKRRKAMVFAQTELVDVTGAKLSASYASVPKVRIGGIELAQVIIAFADAQPFKAFGLEKRPAMLLGIDTLRSFRRVSIDFSQRKVRFLLPDDH
jgi:predicted aspartyl protease